jgi:hypothetical protein
VVSFDGISLEAASTLPSAVISLSFDLPSLPSSFFVSCRHVRLPADGVLLFVHGERCFRLYSDDGKRWLLRELGVREVHLRQHQDGLKEEAGRRGRKEGGRRRKSCDRNRWEERERKRGLLAFFLLFICAVSGS